MATGLVTVTVDNVVGTSLVLKLVDMVDDRELTLEGAAPMLKGQKLDTERQARVLSLSLVIKGRRT